MRLGVFGGSFDPVHCSHLLLAECCLRQARLDRVAFVAAAHQPHKAWAPRASGADRLAMLRLAIGERPEFEASSIELHRGAPSYTVETLRTIREREPDAELFFLLGADALADLPNWREPRAICELAMPLVVHRAGCAEPNFDALAPLVSAERLAAIRAARMNMPPTPISSSDIQRRIAAGEAWESLVPRAVSEYITERQLYAVGFTAQDSEGAEGSRNEE